jgi:hypothetical protein
MGDQDSQARMAGESKGEFEALQTVIRVLQRLDDEARRRIIDAASTFLQIDRPQRKGELTQAVGGVSDESRRSSQPYPPFSDDRSMSPKEFVLAKQPRSDVERIAVLAYYLTHYRDMPQFKTLDLSKLNTEAAQPKFSNAANSANNSVKRNYLVPTTKGQRQLSAAGERFVDALPDREAARQAMAAAQLQRRPRKRTPARAAGA